MSIVNDPFSEERFKLLDHKSVECLGRDLGRLLFRDPKKAWRVANVAEGPLAGTSDEDNNFTNGALTMLCAIVEANRAEYQDKILRDRYTQAAEDYTI
jgi:hypothetical protein